MNDCTNKTEQLQRIISELVESMDGIAASVGESANGISPEEVFLFWNGFL